MNCTFGEKMTGLWNKKGSTSLQFTESQIPEKGMQSELEAQRNEFKLNTKLILFWEMFLKMRCKEVVWLRRGEGKLAVVCWGVVKKFRGIFSSNRKLSTG